jgi:flagellar biosynthesis protein
MSRKDAKKAAAVRYDQMKDLAPKVTAKGHGKMAERIIALAEAHRIPMVEDRNLVQLLDALDIDTEIPPQLYQAVAEVLAFIYRMNSQIAEPYHPRNP